jgi:hypothetical protein
MTSHTTPYRAIKNYPRVTCICNEKACGLLTREFQSLGDARGDFLQVPKVNLSSKCKQQTKRKGEEFERIMDILHLPRTPFEKKKFVAFHHYRPAIIVLGQGKIPKGRCVKVNELQLHGLWGTGREYSEKDQSESDKQDGICRILPTYSLGAAQADWNEIQNGQGQMIPCTPTTNQQNVLPGMMPTMPVLQFPFQHIHVAPRYWSATAQANLCGRIHMNLNELRHETRQNNNYEREEATKLRNEIAAVKERLKAAQEAADHQRGGALNRLDALRDENAAVKEQLKAAKEAAGHQKEEALIRLEKLRNENAAVKEELNAAKEAADHQREGALNRLDALRDENAAVKEQLKAAKQAAGHQKEEALIRLEKLRDDNAAVKEELNAAKEAAHRQEEALNRLSAQRDDAAAVNEELKAAKEAAVHQGEEALKRLTALRADNASIKEELKGVKEAAKRQEEKNETEDKKLRAHLAQAVKESVWRRKQVYMLRTHLSVLQHLYRVEEQQRKEAWEQRFRDMNKRSPMEKYWLLLPPHHPLAVITQNNSQKEKDQAWMGGTVLFEETEKNKKTMLQLRSLFEQRTQQNQQTFIRFSLAHKFFQAIHPTGEAPPVTMSEKHIKMGMHAFHPDKVRGDPALEYMRQRLTAYIKPVIDGVASPFSATNRLGQELSAALVHLKADLTWEQRYDAYVAKNMATEEYPIVVNLCKGDNKNKSDDKSI